MTKRIAMRTKFTVRAWGRVEGFLRGLRRSRSRLICWMLLVPMGAGIEVPSDSLDADVSSLGETGSRTTAYSFGAGMGEFGRSLHVSREIIGTFTDCNGEEYTGPLTVETGLKFRSEFFDAGAEIDRQVSSSWHVGARGGLIHETVYFLGAQDYGDLFNSLGTDTSFSYGYFNPFVSLEKERFGMGLGVVYAGNQLWIDEAPDLGEHDNDSVYPTGHIRIGRMNRLYMNVAAFESVPIYSGGGTIVVGVGGRPFYRLGVWAGMATQGPYDEDNLLVRAGWDISRNLTVGVNVRLKSDSDPSYPIPFSEYGGSVLVTYRYLRP